jgi:branched-chain amino acid transport system substrate-binding protein
MGRDARDGAEFALAEISAARQVRIEPVFYDPHADLAAYLEGARQLLRAGCRHIVGTITSAARKEVIPLVEKHDGLLWYMCPYEGFEANENVIYVGGCPNQHLIPLFEHLIPRFGARPYLVGANYVWGWEMNRLARELINNAAGRNGGRAYRCRYRAAPPELHPQQPDRSVELRFPCRDRQACRTRSGFPPGKLPRRQLRPDGMRACRYRAR